MIARRGPALALALACAVATLTGCTGDDPEPTAAPTPSRTAPAVPPPALPGAAQANTPDGAVEFFKHYIALYNHSYANNDSTAIKKVSEDTCTFCFGVIQNADLSAQKGVRTEGLGMAVEQTRVAKGDEKGGAIVIGTVTQQTGRSLDAQGKVITARTTTRMLELTALMHWAWDHWEMADIQTKGAE